MADDMITLGLNYGERECVDCIYVGLCRYIHMDKEQPCAFRKTADAISVRHGRLIDADALIDFIDCGHLRNPLESCFSERDVVDMLESRPTIDAVPVVRCGECANAKCIDKNESVYTCTHPQWTRRPHKDTFEESQLFHGLDGNDFCSYGAKMEDKPCG